jgi:hypothetical protein
VERSRRQTSVFRLRVTRAKDLAPVLNCRTEHPNRNVNRLTLAFLSRSLTLAVSHPHSTPPVQPETIAA